MEIPSNPDRPHLIRVSSFKKDMKALVKHLLKNNLDEILNKSLLNCHCIGLHSIMLLECPGKTIRLYVADANHELWRNDRVGFLDGSATIGFHAHHCNITLSVVHGEIGNDQIQKSEIGDYCYEVFRYQSAITNGAGGFERIGTQWFKPGIATRIKKGGNVFLSAQDIHTVWVKKGETAAWLVFEGMEDSEYDPFTYSSADLESQPLDDLYKKVEMCDVLRLLKLSNLA